MENVTEKIILWITNKYGLADYKKTAGGYRKHRLQTGYGQPTYNFTFGGTGIQPFHVTSYLHAVN